MSVATASFQQIVCPAAVDAATITICHPVWRMAAGGLERQLLQVIDRLPRDRFRHLLLIRGASQHDPGILLPSAPNVAVIFDPATGRDALWSLRLAAQLQRHRVDLVHARGLSMLVDAVVAARAAGDIPVVFSFHGLEDAAAEFGHIRRLVLRSAIGRCASRWAVSRAAADSLTSRLRLSADAFDIAPNGVDVDRFSPAADRSAVRNALGLDADRPLVLSVGNLKPIKGHDRLLRAIEALGSDARTATFAIIGEDHAEGALHRWASERLNGIDLRFLGRVDDVLPWYQAADLFVLPSLYEGASNALLEAMASGLPVIATDVGGNAELIRHAQNGLLTPPADESALAAAIRFLLTDPAYRAALGAAARETVRRDFDIARTARRYADGYEAALPCNALRRPPTMVPGFEGSPAG